MGFLEKKKNRSKIEQLAKLCLFVLLSHFVFLSHFVTFCLFMFLCHILSAAKIWSVEVRGYPPWGPNLDGLL